MPKEVKNTLKYNHGIKSSKALSIIYVDMKSLPKNIDTCHNNPRKSSATKITKHLVSGYSFFTQS